MTFDIPAKLLDQQHQFLDLRPEPVIFSSQLLVRRPDLDSRPVIIGFTSRSAHTGYKTRMELPQVKELEADFRNFESEIDGKSNVDGVRVVGRRCSEDLGR